MSYMQFQQRCEDCGETWNAAFGMVGTTIIAAPPNQCQKCKSQKIVKHADGWKELSATEQLANLKKAIWSCDKCEKPISSDWKFCPYCGWQLVEDDELQPTK